MSIKVALMIKKTLYLYFALLALLYIGQAFIETTYLMFLMSRGMSLWDVSLIVVVFYAVLLVTEIPSGSLADVFGRRVCCIFAYLFSAMGFFIYASGYSIYWFILAEASFAVGTALTSGAFQAWAVDRLKYYGYQSSLHKLFIREEQVMHLSWIVGVLLGAYLASFYLALPWIMAGSFMLLGAVIAFLFMKEEYFSRKPLSFRQGLRAIKATVKTSIRYGKNSGVLRFIFISMLIHWFAVQGPRIQWQSLVGTDGESSKLIFGFISATMSIAFLVGSMLSPRILRLAAKEKNGMIWAQIGIGLGLLLAVLGNFAALIAGLLFYELSRGVLIPLEDMYLNENIPSQDRATIIGVESMFGDVGGIMGLLLTGFLAQQFSVQAAWFTVAMILIAAMVYLLWRERINAQV